MNKPHQCRKAYMDNPPESTASCFLALKAQLSDEISSNNKACKVTEGSVWLCTGTGVEAW